MIKPKEGKCLDCPENAPEKPLMAKRCLTAPYFHYKKHKEAEYSKKAKSRKTCKSLRLKQTNGITLGQWFQSQINIMPKECENCEDYLSPYAPWASSAYIAHIVPKRYFESVATHPINRLFLCIDCHTNYDRWLSKDIVLMKCWPLAVERFNLFKHLITQDEYKHLQENFKRLMK